MKKEKADKAIHDTGSLAIDVLLTQVKAVAVQPVAVGILRATAHSAKQSSGERFQTFAAKAAPARACALVQNCAGVDYTSEVIKDILLSSIHDPDVRRHRREVRSRDYSDC